MNMRSSAQEGELQKCDFCEEMWCSDCLEERFQEGGLQGLHASSARKGPLPILWKEVEITKKIQLS